MTVTVSARKRDLMYHACDMVLAELEKRLTFQENNRVFVFGGYLYNNWLGAAPVDMDVLVPDWFRAIPADWRKLGADEMVKLTGDIGFTARMAHVDEDGYAMTMDAHLRSRGYYRVPGVTIPVNLVSYNRLPATAMDVAKMADFGICQAVYDGRKLTYTTACEADVASRTMTWNAARGEEERKRRSEPRAARISDRLGLTVVWKRFVPRVSDVPPLRLDPNRRGRPPVMQTTAMDDH